MIYAVGASCFNSAAALEHLRLAVAFSTICTVRDPESKALLQQWGCAPNHIQVTADPAFGLQASAPSRIGQILAAEGVNPQRRKLGVNVRNWLWSAETAVWAPWVVQEVKAFAQRHDLDVLLIPFHVGDDLALLSDDLSLMRDLAAQFANAGIPCHVLGANYGPADVAGVVKTCDLFLGMRFHSCLFALANAVPCVGLAYESKVTTLFKRFELGEWVIDLSAVKPDILADRLERLWISRREVKAWLPEKVEAARESARQNALEARRVMGLPLHQPSDDERLLIENLALKQTVELAAIASRERLAARQAQARNLIEQGRYQEAETVVAKAAILEPTQSEWPYLLGYALHRQAKSGALEQYDRALALGYDEFWVCYNRGLLYLEQGDLIAAQADLERAAALQPGNEDLRRVLNKLSVLLIPR